MKGLFINKFIFVILTAILVSSISSGLARAARENQTVDENALLSLFYDEDELVEASTRSPKPISQVAENVTIITAEDIEAMNAHSVAEVLNRVTGLFMQFFRQDFPVIPAVLIHGSDYEHILVLVDGIRFNEVNSDFPNLSTIPLRIIKRIEVIRGAASSTWGSALGGVINIITKDTGNTATPTGTVSASYGEHNSRDYGGEVAGALGRFGYYLSATGQDSDGIRDSKSFDHGDVYAKFGFAVPGNGQLRFTFGRSRTQGGYYFLPQFDDKGTIQNKASFCTANYDVHLATGIDLNLEAYSHDNKVTDNWYVISTAQQYYKYTHDGHTHGVSGRLALARDRHTIVLGSEYSRRQDTAIDELAQTAEPKKSEEIWAAYVNDTYNFDRLTIIPGVRYDQFTIAENIISPSIGIIYRLLDTTWVRATAGRGFRKPTIGLTAQNADLQPETIWSYQAGIETRAARYFLLKTTLFLHKSDDYWYNNGGVWENGPAYKRKGIEIEIATVPWHAFSVTANTTYVRLLREDRDPSDLYNANLIFAYDNGKIGQARLMGHYNHLGSVFSPSSWNGKFDTFIWDLALNKRIFTRRLLEATLFFTGRNLFKGNDYASDFFPNEGRWLEAGMRFRWW